MENIPLKNRIGTKLFLGLFLVAVIAVAGTSFSHTLLSRRVMKANIDERNLQIARRAATEIELYIADSLSALNSIGECILPFQDPWVRDVLVENLTMMLEKFSIIYLIDENGRVIASSELGRLTQNRPVSPTMELTLARNVRVSQVGLTNENFPYMDVSIALQSPIRADTEGDWTLVGRLDLRSVWELVDDISFGDSGRALLITRDNLLIAHPDKTKVLTSANNHYIAEQISTSMEIEGTYSIKDDKGTPMLISRALVPMLNWYVVIEQPLADAFVPADLIILQNVVLIVVLITVAIVTSLFIAARFSGPLGQLLAGTNRIAQGDLAYRIQIRTEDEIGRLSRSFNTMVADLQTWSERLKESEEKYRLLTENVSDIIFSLDDQGRIIYVNKRISQIGGYAISELMGRNVAAYLSQVKEPIPEALEDSDTDAAIEVNFHGRNGTNAILEAKLVRMTDPDGNTQYYGVARDITERKAVEEKLLAYQQQLRSLASQLSLAEARERKRIASEIHDRIIQALALTRIKLGILQKNGNHNNGEKTIQETIGLIEQTIHETRTLILDVSSPLLHEVGLNAALDRLCEQFGQDHELEISFEDDRMPKRFEDDLSILLYEAVKELLVNAVKHATAKKIRVMMQRRANAAIISVVDDGVGFEVSKTRLIPGESGGYGLFSIKERLESMDGEMEIQSAKAKGTRITLTVPLQNDG